MSLPPAAGLSSGLSRARSVAVREIAARAFPRTVLVTRGRRTTPPRVALTFDDGPDAMTGRYLELLGRLGVRATFFVVGAQAEAAPELVAACAREGHELGGHGWSHTPFDTMRAEALVDELARTERVLPRTPGRRPMVRPPRGSLSASSLLCVALAGFTTVLWSHDSDDCRTADADVVRRRLAPERVGPGAIVLMHEQQAWTLEALPPAVAAFRAAGFELVTVSELME